MEELQIGDFLNQFIAIVTPYLSIVPDWAKSQLNPQLFAGIIIGALFSRMFKYLIVIVALAGAGVTATSIMPNQQVPQLPAQSTFVPELSIINQEDL